MFEQIIPGGITAILAVAGAFAIPIVLIVMLFTFIFKLVKARHEEKIAMIEHGLTEAPSGGKGIVLLVTGLVFGAIGLALVIGLPIAGVAEKIVGGLVPLFIGLALIGGHYLTQKENRRNQNARKSKKKNKF